MHPQDKPDSPGDILAHYGKKGMKWGVRNEDHGTGVGGAKAKDVADHNAKTKAYMEASKNLPEPKTRAESLANLTENQKKFAEKFEGSDGPLNKSTTKTTISKVDDLGKDNGPRLSPAQKKVLIFAGALQISRFLR